MGRDYIIPSGSGKIKEEVIVGSSLGYAFSLVVNSDSFQNTGYDSYKGTYFELIKTDTFTIQIKALKSGTYLIGGTGASGSFTKSKFNAGDTIKSFRNPGGNNTFIVIAY